MTSVTAQQEEVASQSTYNPKFMGLWPLEEQIALLVQEFGLSGDCTLKYIKGMEEKNPKPDGFEGWVAVPKIDAFARRFFPSVFTSSEKDRLAIELVLSKIGQEIAVSNQFAHVHDLEFRRSNRSYDAFYIMGQEQPGEILVFPAQLGLKYRGCSPRAAQAKFSKGEFEIDAFSGACILFTHPNRLRTSNDLFMVCSGSEVLDTHPIFVKQNIRRWNPVYFYGEGFHELSAEMIGAHSVVPDFVHERCGVASGLLI